MIRTVLRQPEQGDGIPNDLAGLRLRWFLSPRLIVALAVTFVVVSAAAVLAFDRLQRPLYGAQAEVVFQPNGTISDFRAQRDVGTQALILRGPAVLGPVSGSTGIPVDKLQKAVSVDLLGQSNLMRITVADPNPATAERVASAVTAEYLQRFSAPGFTSVDPATARLEREVDLLSSTLSKMLDRLEQLARERPASQPPTLEERELRAATTTTLQRIGNLQNQLAAAESKGSLGADVSLLVSPHLLEGRLRPRPVQALAVGALVGLCAAIAVAVVGLWPLLRAVVRNGGAHP